MGRSPCGERGLKFRDVSRVRRIERRSPCGERGLTQLQATGRVDIKILQSIAGHSKITMTMNTYVHKDIGNVEKISRTSGRLFIRA